MCRRKAQKTIITFKLPKVFHSFLEWWQTDNYWATFADIICHWRHTIPLANLAKLSVGRNMGDSSPLILH